MKIKQILLIIGALTLSVVFLYPIYVSNKNKECCKHIQNELITTHNELDERDIEILKLKNTLLERENEILLTNEEVKRLSDENGLFTSMFAEIEGQPGGHEILKHLWNEMGHSK